MDSTHHYFKKHSKPELQESDPHKGDLKENPNKTVPLEEPSAPTALSPLAIHRSISDGVRESRVLAFLFGQRERLIRLYQ